MKKTILFTILALLGISQAVAQEYEYVPFVREGVKWVYSTNNFGEVTPLDPNFPEGTHYLNLEIKGDTVINGITYKAMHKYSGPSINWENDTVPIYVREEDKVVYGIIPDGRRYLDCPIGNNYCGYYMDPYNGQEFVLYDFKDPCAYWESVLDWPYANMYEPLTLDTIKIGDNQAKRYKYKGGEDGFYYVEGIGMDDQARGYTLCFFMGMAMGFDVPNVLFFFSHVIEGGKIIYKGRYFDHNTTELVDEVVADKVARPQDDYYYDLMGRRMGTEVPQAPGIYIHHGNKIVVR